MSEMEDKGTYFYSVDGKRLGSDLVVVPIPLYKGMNSPFASFMLNFVIVNDTLNIHN